MKRNGNFLHLLFLGFLIVLLVCQLSIPSVMANPGWLSGWSYRKSHVINYASNAETLYQKLITVHYGSGTDGDDDVYFNSHGRTDFGDARFTDDDGTTLLDYWLRSKINSDNAVFWVEVADDLSTVAQTIYIYYGKADAATTSNFDATFIFGDPFSSATLDTDRWTSVDGNPTYSIVPGFNWLEVTDMDSGNWYTGKGFHSKTLTLPTSWIIEDAYDTANGVYIYELTTAIEERQLGCYSLHHTSWGTTDYGIVYVMLGDIWIGSQGYAFDIGVGGNIDYGRTGTFTSSYTAYWVAKKLSGAIIISDSGTQRVSEANSETPSIFHLGISKNTAFGTQRFGAFKIRKYVSPEPSHGAWGSEETGVPTNDALTLDLTGANYKGTKTLLTGKQDYKFVHKVTDANGVTDITYAEIRLDYATKNVILRATRSSGDAWTFAEQSDPSNYVTLNTGGSSHSTSGDQKTFNFLVTINWNWDDAGETLGVRCYVIDSQSTSDQDDYANIFGVENDLSSSSLSVNDYHCNPSQTLTFSGYWYYEGTSIAPPDGNYAVVIKLSGVQKGSTDTTLLSGAFSISDATAESTVNSYSYTVEATYMSGAGSFSAVTVDGLSIFNIQTPEYFGNATYIYKAQIKYAFNSSTINGASVNISLPTGSIIGQVTSNSTGWISFTLSQSNATESGSYTVFGVNDNNFGITVSIANQTFTLRSWTCNSMDYEGNGLSETTLNVTTNSQTVYSGGDVTLQIPEDTFNVTITWYAIQVNTTTNLVISGDTSTNFTCLAYPYVYESTTYWVASNATISSVTWNSDVLTVQFSGSSATYVLKASCIVKPSYILNCTYDYDADWTTMLTLTHYANTTITIAYPNWGGFYVKKSDYRLISVGWNGEFLSLTFTGNTGNVGEVKIYCANRGAPVETSGFAATSYSASTKTFVGTYAFGSDKTVGVSWAGSGTSSEGGPSGQVTSLLISINIVLQPQINAGSQVDGVINVKWSGATIMYVYNVKFENFTAWFSVAGLPYKLQKAFENVQGESAINVKVSIPSNAAAGNYLIPCMVVFRTEASQDITLGGTLKFEVLGAPSTIPDYMVLVFLSVFAIILLGAMTRSKHKA